jgi:hypothetical protein
LLKIRATVALTILQKEKGTIYMRYSYRKWQQLKTF